MADPTLPALPVREAVARHLHAAHSLMAETWEDTAQGRWLHEADLILDYLRRPDVLAEVAAMASGSDAEGVHVFPSAFNANAVDPDDMEAHHWTVRAEWRGKYGWAVTNGFECLSVVDGVPSWSYEPIPSEREEDFYARTRFPMVEAIRWARVMASQVTINGYTVEDARRMAARRKARADA